MAAKDYVALREQWNIDHGYPVDAPATYGSTDGPGFLRDVNQVATNIAAPVITPITASVGQALSDFDKSVGISAISREATQFSKDIGLTGAVKEVSDVVHGIGKAAEEDPLQYAAIVACIAAAPFTSGASLKLIPYIQATAKVTSKQMSVEDVIKEGAKAYVISSAASAAGDYVAGDPVTGDITGGYVPATGVTGATGSMAVGKAAGNISANVIANAAKGGKATVGDIVAAGVSDAGLAYLAQTYTPDWTSLTPKQQAAAIDGVKTVLGDKSAASKLVNDALGSSIQAATTAAMAVGYDNPWQKQAAEEGGFTDAKTFKAADKLGITNIGEYGDAIKGGFSSGDELREAKTYGIANKTDLMDLKSSMAQNSFASQVTQVGEDLYALPENAGLFNSKTGEVTDFDGKVIQNMFEGILKEVNKLDTNQFVRRPQTTTGQIGPMSATDALSQAAQVIPDYLQDPSQIAKRKERGTPYSTNPEYSVLNPQAPLTPQTQPQQKPQPLALPNPEVVQSGLFSGILSPYNPQNTQGGPYG